MRDQSCVTGNRAAVLRDQSRKCYFTAVMYFDLLLCGGDICVTVAVIDRCCKGV